MVRQSNFTKKILFLKTKISEMLHDFMLKSMLIDKKSAFSGIGKMKTRIVYVRHIDFIASLLLLFIQNFS